MFGKNTSETQTGTLQDLHSARIAKQDKNLLKERITIHILPSSKKAQDMVDFIYTYSTFSKRFLIVSVILTLAVLFRIIEILMI